MMLEVLHKEADEKRPLISRRTSERAAPKAPRAEKKERQDIEWP